MKRKGQKRERARSLRERREREIERLTCRCRPYRRQNSHGNCFGASAFVRIWSSVVHIKRQKQNGPWSKLSTVHVLCPTWKRTKRCYNWQLHWRVESYCTKQEYIQSDQDTGATTPQWCRVVPEMRISNVNEMSPAPISIEALACPSHV